MGGGLRDPGDDDGGGGGENDHDVSRRWRCSGFQNHGLFVALHVRVHQNHP